MGAVLAMLVDELGYDPDDGVPQVGDVAAGVARGSVIRAREGARSVAVARLASGKLVVVADECPHDGGRISDGFVEGERLVCARHGRAFAIANGRCVPEACRKLRE